MNQKQRNISPLRDLIIHRIEANPPSGIGALNSKGMASLRHDEQGTDLAILNLMTLTKGTPSEFHYVKKPIHYGRF